MSPSTAITSPANLRPRHDSALPARLALSAATPRGSFMRTHEVPGWMARIAQVTEFQVERIPLTEPDEWGFAEDTGNLVHRTGRFFRVEGLRVAMDGGHRRQWTQPIINQPEIGILGILAKEFDGVLHFLMQAKMEPGNPNLLQISPTVQATRSNYTQVHQGRPVKYLEYFLEPQRHGRVLADALQSEHGAWFFRKRNRNMIVEVAGEVPLHDGFCWLTLGQLGGLLRMDNVVNMDARTVLAGAPVEHGETAGHRSDTELLSWCTWERTRHHRSAELVPLSSVSGWTRRPSCIEHDEGRYFRVVAVNVRAGNREVDGWAQPLFEPCAEGIVAFLTRRIGGVPHLLVASRAEAGFLDTIELGPTVQCVPANHAHLDPGNRPLFLDTVLSAGPARIRYEAVHSEEGGRFRNAESRYLVIDADEDDAPLSPPPGFAWVTLDQLNSLVRHSHYVNVQARSLLACLNTGAVPW